VFAVGADRTADLALANELLTLEISERQRVEEDLRKSRERFQLAMEGTGERAFATASD